MATVRTMSSAAKFVMKKALLPSSTKIPTINLIQPQILSSVPVRWGTFDASPNMDTRPVQTEVEVISDPKVWACVERLIRPAVVPQPTPKAEYPSGWKPPCPNPNLPYFIDRNRNHMIPVYFKKNRRTNLLITRILRVQGDIWALESELKKYLEKREARSITTSVNEALGILYIRGDHVNNTIDFLEQKGF